MAPISSFLSKRPDLSFRVAESAMSSCGAVSSFFFFRKKNNLIYRFAPDCFVVDDTVFMFRRCSSESYWCVF